MSTIEINRMSKIERLQTMEAIWDSLIHEESGIESSWMAYGCSFRKKKYDDGTAIFLSMQELKSKHRK
ncbi:MAG: addiction module protein [Pseudomonadota bacterium]|nr:addiction module protein [Pseudomonadota bacterium]